MQAEIESLFVSFKHNNVDRLFGVIYRPPSLELAIFFDVPEAILSHIRCNYNDYDVYLMGDFNLDLLRIDNRSDIMDSVTSMFSSGYYPLILTSTRVFIIPRHS